MTFLMTVVAVTILEIVGYSLSGGLATESAAINTRSTPQASARVEDSPTTLTEGMRLYAAYCQSCHGDRHGKGTTAGAAPHNEKGHSWHHPDKQLLDWILNGKFGAPAMPKFKNDLTEEEVGAILRFIKTWWTPDQREMQADISRRFQR